MLSTFLDRSEPELAGLVFHELAHQVVYVKDSTEFNESFATAVENVGVERWLRAAGREEQLSGYLEAQAGDEAVAELVAAARERLRAAYAAPAPDTWKRERKAAIIEELRTAHAELAAGGGRAAAWDAFFARDLNNAHLAALGAYHQLVPAFTRLLEGEDGDLVRFYATVAELARLQAPERTERLEALLE